MLDIVKDADNDNGVVLTEKRPGKFRGSDLLRQKQGKRGEGGGIANCRIRFRDTAHQPTECRGCKKYFFTCLVLVLS